MSAEEKFEKFLVGPHLHPGTEYLRSKQLFFAGHASRDEEVNKLRALCLELVGFIEMLERGIEDARTVNHPLTKHKVAIEKLRGEK